MSSEPEQVRQAPAETFKPPAAVRFLIAAILVTIVTLYLPRICFAIFGAHVVVADSVYRWSGSAILVAGYIFFSRVLDQVEADEWAYIGLPRQRVAIRQTLLGVGLGAVLISLSVAAIAAGGSLNSSFEVSSIRVVHAGMVVFLLLGGALLEELMFRGYPFQRLIEAIGIPGAILLLSAFFGAVHLNNPNAGGIWSWGFFNTLAVGVLFAIAYLRTRTLWLPFGIHFGWNFFLGVVYGLPVSGIKDFSVIVRSTAHGSKLLTGGAYGIEGSLTGSVTILLGIIFLGFCPKRLLGIEPAEFVNPGAGI